MKKKMMRFCGMFGGMFAALAMVMTTLTANSTCIYLSYQDEMPESAKNLRKF